jgi:hypothetical protein
MTSPVPERFRTPAQAGPRKDRATGQSALGHGLIGVKVKVMVNSDDFLVDMRDLELRTGGAEAVFEVEHPQKSFSLNYQIQSSVVDEIVRIRRRYPQQHQLRAGPDLRKDRVHEGEGLHKKISRLLRWQEFLEVAGTLRESADVADVGKRQNLLIDAVQGQYRDGVGKLRHELVEQQDGIPVIRDLLHSGNDALTFLAIRLMGDPSVRAVLQHDLLSASRDFRLSRDTRNLARAYLRSWLRSRVDDEPEHGHQHPDRAAPEGR